MKFHSNNWQAQISLRHYIFTAPVPYEMATTATVYMEWRHCLPRRPTECILPNRPSLAYNAIILEVLA